MCAYRLNPFTSNFDDIGSGSPTIEPAKVKLYDPLTTSVTTGAAISSPFIVDGVTVANDDLVLFSNLGIDNNQIYKATISGSDISWVAQLLFISGASPIAGTLAVVQQGSGFANQLGEFDGSGWKFGESVRKFRGIDYVQEDAIVTSTLTDDTVDGTIFTVAYAGSENMLIDFSLSRGGVKEAGRLNVTTDGSDVALSTSSAALADAGVIFSAAISGSDIVLKYTTSASGSDALLKYTVKRWSDNPGGPAGIPSYSGGGGGSSTSASGSTGDVQFNSGGLLGSNSNFSYDTVNNILNLGGLELSGLNSVSLNDNQIVPSTAFTSPASANSMIVEYSVSRGSNFRTGTFLFSTDGTTTSFFDDYVEQGSTNVVFSSTISGGSVLVQYTSTSTGTAPVFKYSFRRWSA